MVGVPRGHHHQEDIYSESKPRSTRRVVGWWRCGKLAKKKIVLGGNKKFSFLKKREVEEYDFDWVGFFYFGTFVVLA